LEEVARERAERGREKEQKRLHKLHGDIKDLVREGWLNEAAANIKGGTPEERAQQRREVYNAVARRKIARLTPEEKAQYAAKRAAGKRKLREKKGGLRQALQHSSEAAEATDEGDGDDDDVYDDDTDEDDDDDNDDDDDELGSDEKGYVGLRVQKDFGGGHGVRFGTVVKQNGPVGLLHGSIRRRRQSGNGSR